MSKDSAAIRLVWAMKRAAQKETAHCKTAAEYFAYIHRKTAHYNLPEATRRGAAAAVQKRRKIA